MTDAIRPLIAGNWKMNGLKSSRAEFDAMRDGAPGRGRQGRSAGLPAGDPDRGFRGAGVQKIAVGAQDCHPKASGAHTGDLSAEMLADSGASAIIVGHSERRADHGETDVLVRQKARSRLARRPHGHRLHRRDPGPARCRANPRHLRRPAYRVAAGWATSDNLVVAYEPVWAIGTGLTSTAGDVEQIHAFIRDVSSRPGLDGGGQDPHPLWRLGEALECEGTDGGCQRQRRAGRGRQPESSRFPGDRGRVLGKSVALTKCENNPMQSRN